MVSVLPTTLSNPALNGLAVCTDLMHLPRMVRYESCKNIGVCHMSTFDNGI